MVERKFSSTTGFPQDGIVDQINFDNSDKNSVWQSENLNLANKNIQSIQGKIF